MALDDFPTPDFTLYYAISIMMIVIALAIIWHRMRYRGAKITSKMIVQGVVSGILVTLVAQLWQTYWYP